MDNKPMLNKPNMKTEALFVHDLFDRVRRFDVPHYQRGLAWEVDQVEKILNDVEEAANSNLQEYFIGPLMFLQRSVGHCDIIDGQQRITVILLILCYCADRISENSEDQENQRIGFQINQIIGHRNAPKLHHKNSDEAKNFRDILNQNVMGKTRTHLSDAYDAIADFFENADKWTHSTIAKFAYYLINNVMCITITSNEQELTYQIFETLNSRGKKLSEIDLIRNRLFRELGDEDVITKDRVWKDLRQWLVGHSRVSTKRIDSQIQDIFATDLNIHEGKWIEPKNLYRGYTKQNRMTGHEPGVIIDRVCGLPSYNAYIRSTRPADGNNEGNIRLVNALHDFASLKVMLPLTYAMFYREYDNRTITKNVEIAGSFCSRLTVALNRFPVSIVGQTLSNIAHSLYFKDVDEQNSSSLLLEKIKKCDTDSGWFVTDDQSFESQLSTLPSISPAKAKTIFIAIRNNKAQTSGDRLNRSHELHIEHVLPEEFPPRGWGQFTPDEHVSYHQRLGNMLLLAEKLNKEAARKPFSKKREIYQESDYKNVAFIDELSDWNTKVIRERQSTIAEELTKVWKVSLF